MFGGAKTKWNSLQIILANDLQITTTVMVALLFPIGLVTVHVYVPLSLVVTLSME